MKKTRNSSLELLKIIAMFLIALNHGIQSTNLVNGVSTTNVDVLMLTIFRCSGNLGNIIFVICSAYFLLDSSKSKKDKILNIIFDSFCISMMWLFSFMFMNYNLSGKVIIKQFFPLLFNNNWFIVCYILLYLGHPYLNMTINKCDKVTLLRINVVFLILYSLIQMITVNNFCFTNFIGFVVVYFVVAYCKKYLVSFNNNIKLNLFLMLFSLVSNTLFLVVVNYLGLSISILGTRTLHSNYVMTNPLYILFGITIFNIFNSKIFYNKFINSVSAVSLVFYLIHENDLFRSYLRPDLFQYVTFNSYTVINTVVLSLLYFVLSIIISFIYVRTIQKIVYKLSNKIYLFMKKMYLIVENKLLEIN